MLRDHGQDAAFTKTGNLSLAAQAALRGIDRHFHDLREETGSLRMDGGVSLATTPLWLGTNMSQTSTYPAGTADAERAAIGVV